MKKMILTTAFALAAFLPTTFAQTSKFYCQQTANGYCAVNPVHGQCAHSWERRDTENPKYACMKFIGAVPSSVNRNHLACKKTPTGACTVDLRTGQCSHAWRDSEDDNAMWHCQRFLGGGSRIDRTGYFCRRHGSSYCAVNPRNNQCTQSWSKRDSENPRAACENFIRR